MDKQLRLAFTYNHVSYVGFIKEIKPPTLSGSLLTLRPSRFFIILNLREIIYSHFNFQIIQYLKLIDLYKEYGENAFVALTFTGTASITLFYYVKYLIYRLYIDVALHVCLSESYFSISIL